MSVGLDIGGTKVASALLGASRLRLTRGIDELSVDAELGGVAAHLHR